jgi:predicted ArsR family transcriptional regulator
MYVVKSGDLPVQPTRGVEPRTEPAGPATAEDSRDSRNRVARLLLEQGRLTVTELAAGVGITPAAVRRHVDALVADGLAEDTDPRQRGPRGRGRPARAYRLTDAGRHEFEQAYDELAVEALSFLAEVAGEDAVEAFARARLGHLEERYRLAVAALGHDQAAEALVELLTEDGYAASVEPSPLGGRQICQHHCPVAHVASRFPQLCEAETEVISRLLGTHVQRLATIAHGDGVCTTHLPASALAALEQRPLPLTQELADAAAGAMPFAASSGAITFQAAPSARDAYP